MKQTLKQKKIKLTKKQEQKTIRAGFEIYKTRIKRNDTFAT